MSDQKIEPEKITHPFQLMAAWFVMLIIISGMYLAAAAKIDRPVWASGFLICSALLLSIIVMAAVFVMLTVFRPNLQGPKEYYEWLKDERRYSNQPRAGGAEAPTVPVLIQGASSPRRVSESRQFPITGSFQVSISRLPKCDELMAALTRLGYNAEVYRAGIGEERPEDHEAIWVGARASSADVIKVIKTAIAIWPQLRYMHVSSDGGGPPDYIHDQVFLGGATATAKEFGLKMWSREEIMALRDDLARDQLHRMIREHYA